MKLRLAFVVGGLACLLGAGLVRAAQIKEMPPAWPYGQPQLAPGVVPPQAPAQRTPAFQPPAPPAPNAPQAPLLQAAGSKLQFTQQQVGNSYSPADWFPEDHPAMPEIVAHGKPSTSTSRACGLCHLPDGRGRPENAPLIGLPSDYIVQQLHDFQQGLRRSADPRKANTGEMENTAKAMTEDEIKEAAAYFSSVKRRKYIRVVETDMVPAFRIQGEIYFNAENGQQEPIGTRIIEMAESTTETQLRNPRSGFVAYVPVGSVQRGQALATTGNGGKTVACVLCHGPELTGMPAGLGPLFGQFPNLAGRSPSYLARQIYDIKLGTRRGPVAELMKPVVANLTDADIVDVVAYISSLEP